MEPVTQNVARAIMGGNFLDVRQAVTAFGQMTSGDIAALTLVPWDEATLQGLQETHLLVADTGISIARMQEHGYWIEDWNEWWRRFSFTEHTEPVGWRLLRKMPVPGSPGKTWDEQQLLLSANEEVPTPRAVVYAIILALRQGNRLFNEPVRTSEGIKKFYPPKERRHLALQLRKEKIEFSYTINIHPMPGQYHVGFVGAGIASSVRLPEEADDDIRA